LTEMAIEAGVDDIQDAGENFELYCDPSSFIEAARALEEAGLPLQDSTLTMIPKNTVSLDENGARKVLKMMDMLEDNDDVQNVYANFDIDDVIMEKLAGE
ncbi:MAG TPA: YebC/PmpR family DNA-binding transcriptional regulator, partial [Candidatus Mcinerneyibacteriales bacterium]|nr:YebC/PmpR family DNA-binding transcriptional regulator [Candidatus Mcinerneyibacteriales bacterium]